jgi:DNA-binding response OmpR family regulator
MARALCGFRGLCGRVLHLSHSGVVVKDSSSSTPTLRFGVFELNPQSGELRKQGIKIRLQGQPVEILAMLLEHPGEPVTRDELQKKLWPADTFVDFEQGLNNAMKRLAGHRINMTSRCSSSRVWVTTMA